MPAVPGPALAGPGPAVSCSWESAWAAVVPLQRPNASRARRRRGLLPDRAARSSHPGSMTSVATREAVRHEPAVSRTRGQVVHGGEAVVGLLVTLAVITKELLALGGRDLHAASEQARSSDRPRA